MRFSSNKSPIISPAEYLQLLRENKNNSSIFGSASDADILYPSSGSGSADLNDYDDLNSTVNESKGTTFLKSACHYEDQPSGFILLLQLNFWVMFMFPLLVSKRRFYKQPVSTVRERLDII